MRKTGGSKYQKWWIDLFCLMVNLNTEYARDIVHGCRQMYNLRQKYIQNNVYIIVMSELAFSSLGNWLGK